MDKTTLLAAKSNKDGLWECVPQHLCDTANVMKQLCDQTSGWVTPAFIEATGIETSVFEKISVFLAATHDIGKMTPIFQKKISFSLPGLSDRLQAYGFDVNVEEGDTSFYHAFVSGAILREYYEVNSSVCEVLAAHHGIPRKEGKGYNWRQPFKIHKENVLGKSGEFQPLWEEVVAAGERISGIQCKDIPEISSAAQILLSGLLITADWISSNECFFPLARPWDISALTDENRGYRGYQESGVRRGWFPSVYRYDCSLFVERFGFQPNCLQETAGYAAGAGAQFMIVEGPMGSGKTEAALMSAEILATRSASGGFYIGLPTQATSNGLLLRIARWASKVSDELPVSINLAHGGADFNDEYRAFQTNTSEEAGLTVNKWMSGKHRQLMSDFVDGTIDQALKMALNRKYFMLLHEQLAGKVVVFDEVHSYDAYTNAYLETTLAYLGLYHCPTVLLSATLTAEKKESFIRAYTQRKSFTPKNSSCYPCVTWWDGDAFHEDEISQEDFHKLTAEVFWIQSEQLPNRITEMLAHGGCAGVIRNTVKEAIKTSVYLKESLPGYRVILIHSRFLMDDRSKLESQIITLTGKSSTSTDRDRLVVVGTQVLEQSLDLDFDVLFTDPCPMDLLLQRLGREHRHKRIRPECLEKAKVYLITDGDMIIGTNDRPYNRYIIDRTCELLRETGGKITIPDDIKVMVEKTYNLTLTEDNPAKDAYKKRTEILKKNSGCMRIPDPWFCESIKGMGQFQENSADEQYVGSEGVRQGDDSITVLLLKSKNGYIMDVAEKASCMIGNLPDSETGDVFLRQLIHLPLYMIAQDELTRMKNRTGFGEEGIWKYKEILLLDENCCYEHRTGKSTIKYWYSPKTGLMEVEK